MDKARIKVLSVIVLGGIVMIGSFFGCSPEMRRKFVRERKTDRGKNEVLPVLDPVDYPNTLETSRTRYEYFYALLKVWQKDALMMLDDGASDKQMRYTLGQVKVQLLELSKIFEGVTFEVAQEGIRKTEEVLGQYDRPAALRNISIIRRDIDRLSDTVIKPLAAEAVLKDLK